MQILASCRMTKELLLTETPDEHSQKLLRDSAPPAGHKRQAQTSMPGVFTSLIVPPIVTPHACAHDSDRYGAEGLAAGPGRL